MGVQSINNNPYINQYNVPVTENQPKSDDLGGISNLIILGGVGIPLWEGYSLLSKHKAATNTTYSDLFSQYWKQAKLDKANFDMALSKGTASEYLDKFTKANIEKQNAFKTAIKAKEGLTTAAADSAISNTVKTTSKMSAAAKGGFLMAGLKMLGEIPKIWDSFKNLGTGSGIKQTIKSTAKAALVYGGWVGGAKIGAWIGTAICPGAGTAVGTAIGAALGTASSFLGSMVAEKLGDKLFKDEPDIAKEKQKKLALLTGNSSSTPAPGFSGSNNNDIFNIPDITEGSSSNPFASQSNEENNTNKASQNTQNNNTNSNDLDSWDVNTLLSANNNQNSLNPFIGFNNTGIFSDSNMFNTMYSFPMNDYLMNPYNKNDFPFSLNNQFLA